MDYQDILIFSNFDFLREIYYVFPFIIHINAINNRKISIQIKAVCLLDIVPRGARGGIAGLGGIIGKS